MADGRFILSFRRVLLGSSLFQHVYHFMLRQGTECDGWERRSKMADGQFEVFRRALLGRSFFAHVAPLRSRPGMASIIWESLVSIGGCSRENFADNRFALLFIYTSRKARLRRAFLLWRTDESYPAPACPRQQIYNSYLGANTLATAVGSQ